MALFNTHVRFGGASVMKTTQEFNAPFARATARVYDELGRFAGKIPPVQLMICGLAADVEAGALPGQVRDAALAGLASLSAITALLPCRADAPIEHADSERTYVSWLADIATETICAIGPDCDPVIRESAVSVLAGLCDLLWAYSA